jgi:hypothetical protein
VDIKSSTLAQTRIHLNEYPNVRPDHNAEFLEIANTINGKRIWNIYGPDLDGRFGGLHAHGIPQKSTCYRYGSLTRFLAP